MRPVAFRITVVLCLIVAGLVFAAWDVGLIGGKSSGTARSASELPMAGAQLAKLQPAGPIHYKLYRDPRGPHLVASGTTTVGDVRRFCDAFGLEFSESYPRPGSVLRDKLARYRGDQTRIAVDFGDADAFAMGQDPKLGHVELHFRHRDGVWTASVSFPLE